MEKSDMLKLVDHTLLKNIATWEQIQTLCEEAVAWGTASVCVPPSFVKRIYDKYGKRLNICTVIGFPLGYSTTESKVAETRQAVAEGAGEVDMVVDLGAVKEGRFSDVTAQIKDVAGAAQGRVLKVIVECCCLTQEEKEALCHCVTEAGADYIKTSTGFGAWGAKLEDIALFKAHIGPDVKIKAAGGIRSLEDFENFSAAGCQRIGSSSAALLAGE